MTPAQTPQSPIRIGFSKSNITPPDGIVLGGGERLICEIQRLRHQLQDHH